VHAPTAADPILVMGTTHDPATPYKQAVALTHQLGDARLVTLDGDGHTAFLRGDTCIDAAGDAYLTDLRLPAKGLTCH
jgi:pimeloyl-ACP methyl ester carboxylesterase